MVRLAPCAFALIAGTAVGAERNWINDLATSGFLRTVTAARIRQSANVNEGNAGKGVSLRRRQA
jgi:hypothetical protein